MPVRRRAAYAIAALSILASVAACTVPGTPVPVNSTSGGIRQTDDSGIQLPFHTRLSKRWNASNNGTTYEPCTALSSDQVDLEGWDSSTVRDAAGSDGQTLRGCTWSSTVGNEAGGLLSQFVGNSRSLDHVVERSPDDEFTHWLDEQVVNGRRVGVLVYNNRVRCETYVQSGQAGVHTAVSVIATLQPPISEICDRALAFTRATIDKMPV